jgi:hypothetical protein
MKIEYIKESIEKDIYRIREDSNLDVSKEVGAVLYDFISYWKEHKGYKSTKIHFLEVVQGLENYLTFTLKNHAFLTETRITSKEIECVLLIEDKKSLSRLLLYLKELKQRRGKQTEQISKYIPEELLGRK